MQQDVILEGLANLLMQMSNTDLGSLSGKARTYVRPAVAVTGNWVGGRIQLTTSCIRFEMNQMNKRFQSVTDPVEIPLAEITTIAQGRMMLFFATADVTTSTGLFRFRLSPGKTTPFLAILGKMLGE